MIKNSLVYFNATLILQDDVTGLDEIRLRPPKGQAKRIPQLQGFVEIRHNGKWTKICSQGWNKEIANVICGQLGFPKAARIPHLQTYLYVKNFFCKLRFIMHQPEVQYLIFVL